MTPEDLRRAASRLRQAIEILESEPLTALSAVRLRSDLADLEAVATSLERGPLTAAASPGKNRHVQTPIASTSPRARTLRAAAKVNRTATAAHPLVKWLDARGLTLAEWSRANDLSYKRVHAWVAGRNPIERARAEEIERETDRAVPVTAWLKVSE